MKARLSLERVAFPSLLLCRNFGLRYLKANNDGNGTITFVDPAGGMQITRNTQKNADGSIRIMGTDYGPAGTSYVQILGAVSESPVPEPRTTGLALSALVALAYFARRPQRRCN